MTSITFSGSLIQSWIFSIFLTIVVPLGFSWYFKKKTQAKAGAFLVGIAFSLLFTFILAVCFNTFVLKVLSLDFLFDPTNHPVYAIIYGSASTGLMATLGTFVGLRYAMKQRPGKENALLFGLGKGSLESILNGGTVYITNIIAAIFINSLGSEEYFQKLSLPAAELERTRTQFLNLANTSGSTFIISATYYLLAICVHTSLAVFLCQAARESKSRISFLIAFVLQTLSYAPMYLARLYGLENSLVLLVMDSLYTFAVIFYFYRYYHKIQRDD